MDPTEKSLEAQRRSTRIRAQIPLRVTSLDPAVEFTEHCHTLVVNTQGCGVRVSRPLEPGLPVRLDELPTGQTVTARVANCVPLGSEGKYWLVGLGLDQAGNIWGIAPAPADWGSESKAFAAAAAVSNPAKKSEWPYSQFSRKGEFHPGRK
ncbi:MAG: PilZ domain-containing protein [Acidobacteriia bacterium]|nr:PilZ domain-containing protein [Terriglobia bacterium]